MKLQTQIPLEKESNNQIDYNSNILLLGSCFVENIGEKLNYFKFQNSINPFGILFHPKAIENLIVNAVENKRYSDDDVFFQNEQWHCFEAHSKLSNSSKESLLEDLNAEIKLTNLQIHKSSHIIITLGTTWVYNFIESNQIVANCHKVVQKKFKKELLSVDSVFQSLNNIVAIIQKINNKAKVVFTVSPIRHLKDGFVENTISKSHLITAIHQIVKQQNNAYYFPSYEIMMDELRDYRFYSEDMLHPNNVAVNYIWNKFKGVWISNEASKVMKEVDVIQKGLLHKPFNLNSEAHLQFLEKLDSKKELLKKQFPYIKF